ncbi:MAG: diacylglycerol kinase [Chloroflexi bacterium]|nr:diacylglycerol kinase [Chloroflexota bacterium]
MRLVRAARYTTRGFRHALGTDTSFRQEFVLALILGPVGVWLGDSGVERVLLLFPLFLVLLAELLNGAIETTVDRIGSEWNELSGRAKDLSSAAVFIALVNVPVVWGLVLLG